MEINLNLRIGKGKGWKVVWSKCKELEEGEYRIDKAKKVIEFKPDEFDWMRKAGGKLVKLSTKLGDITVKPKGKEEEFAYKFTEGAVLASYTPTYKSKEKKKKATLYLDVSRKVKKWVDKARIMAESQNYARKLANMPPNIATPERMVEEAKKLAKSLRLKINVIDKKKMAKLGMNTILAVNRGSAKGAYLVELVYNGGKEEIAVVGKGITFDSGGLQVKPSRYMLNMHLDKTGACVALGVIRAAALLKLPYRVRAIAVFTENMNGANATTPNSVIKSYSGKTVEIQHTDAEGRLILADAVAYASEKKPKLIIDIATLTGAMSVALGDKAMGLFTNADEYVKFFEKAGEEEYERVWQMPMWKEYDKMMESDVADIKNIGSWEGDAGSITGAKFIEFFVKGRWVHLDIASVMEVKNHAYLGTGGSATSVRAIVRALELMKKKK